MGSSTNQNLVNNFKDESTIWLVIDARTTQYGVLCGISRFVIGLTKALTIELSEKQNSSNSSQKKLKILIVSKSKPADWIFELVHKYPTLVSFWSGGPGALTKAYDKPVWLWSTIVFKRIQKLTHNQIIWFAPGNFDRPLFVSQKGMAGNVIQVVHDNIPFLNFKGMGWLFKTQFKALVKRALAKLPYIATVSNHSSLALQEIAKKRISPIQIIENGVDQEFGMTPKIVKEKELKKERLSLLLNILQKNELDPNLVSNLSEKIINTHWILGVGRSQKYKSWDIIESAITKFSEDANPLKLWFLRVGADNKEIAGYAKKSACVDMNELKIFEDIKIICFSGLSEKQLIKLYSISDLLVHPSEAEGFGIPPLEAVLCGTPVLYRSSTAVDSHFSKDALPSNFWRSVSSNYSAIWAKEIQKILLDPKDSTFYTGLNKAKSTREYIIEETKETNGKKFEWKTSASIFLEWLNQNILSSKKQSEET